MADKNPKNIESLLHQNYFWDIDITSGKHVSSRLIIERVFNFGTLREIALVIKTYGRGEVVRTLMNLNYIDPKTLNFISRFFNRKKEEFRCYTRRQLRVQHWDY